MKTTFESKWIVSGQARMWSSAPMLTCGGKVRQEAGGYCGPEGQMPRMVLDSEAHWNWRNPLNLIPLAMLVLMLYALVGTLLG